MGLSKAGRFSAQTIDNLHHSFAALEFSVGQVLRLGGIDFTRHSLCCTPRQEHPPVTHGVEEPASRLNHSVCIFDTTHCEPQPREDLFTLICRSGRSKDVTISTR